MISILMVMTRRYIDRKASIISQLLAILNSDESELILLLNGVDEDFHEFNQQKNVKILKSETTLTRSRARNLVAKNATSLNIMFLDPHVDLTVDDYKTLKGLVGLNFDIIQPTINVDCKSSKPTNTLERLRFFNRVTTHGSYNGLFYKNKIPAFDTACIIISKKVFDELGGFWEKIDRYEDREFCLRALENGYRCLGTSKVVLTKYVDKKSSIYILKNEIYDMKNYFKAYRERPSFILPRDYFKFITLNSLRATNKRQMIISILRFSEIYFIDLMMFVFKFLYFNLNRIRGVKHYSKRVREYEISWYFDDVIVMSKFLKDKSYHRYFKKEMEQYFA